MIVISDASADGDDCAAIRVIASNDCFKLEKIVATSGNVWAEEAAENIRALLRRIDHGGIDIDVFPSGFLKPRLHQFQDANGAAKPHGYIGALGRSFPITTCIEFDFLEIVAHLDRPAILMLGPLSALAYALSRQPRIIDYIGDVHVMGGAIEVPGNATGNAEFNFWFDPVAADIVLGSGLPITLLTLDAVDAFRRSHAAHLKNQQHPCRATGDIETPNSGNRFICDELLAAALVDPNVVSSRASLKLAVETRDGSCLGALSVLPATSSRKEIDVIEKIGPGALKLIS